MVSCSTVNCHPEREEKPRRFVFNFANWVRCARPVPRPPAEGAGVEFASTPQYGTQSYNNTYVTGLHSYNIFYVLCCTACSLVTPSDPRCRWRHAIGAPGVCQHDHSFIHIHR